MTEENETPHWELSIPLQSPESIGNNCFLAGTSIWQCYNEIVVEVFIAQKLFFACPERVLPLTQNVSHCFGIHTLRTLLSVFGVFSTITVLAFSKYMVRGNFLMISSSPQKQQARILLHELTLFPRTDKHCRWQYPHRKWWILSQVSPTISRSAASRQRQVYSNIKTSIFTFIQRLSNRRRIPYLTGFALDLGELCYQTGSFATMSQRAFESTSKEFIRYAQYWQVSCTPVLLYRFLKTGHFVLCNVVMNRSAAMVVTSCISASPSSGAI